VTFIWRCRNDSCILSMEQVGIYCSSVASTLPFEVRSVRFLFSFTSCLHQSKSSVSSTTEMYTFCSSPCNLLSPSIELKYSEYHQSTSVLMSLPLSVCITRCINYRSRRGIGRSTCLVFVLHVFISLSLNEQLKEMKTPVYNKKF
jgi:hypothetical protein